MNIAVIGTGYVGLVVGACLAETGNDVECVDRDAAKIRDLEKAILPIYEPGLQDLVERNQRTGRLSFTTAIEEAVPSALPPDDPRVRKPDISRARELLGWEPKVTLHEGLERTIPYFRSVLGLAG